ncbi:MAG TPA: ATP-binding protein [Kofleriaceae bacterium]
MADDPVVIALRAALAGSESLDVRVALAERLMAIGAPREALVEYERGIALAPTNASVLAGAAKAADACGESAKAAGYRAAVGAPAPILRLVPDAAPEEPEAEPPTTFADVGGMDAAKQRLHKAFIAPLRNPDLYKSFGRKIGGGLILFGPPGCGKTFLARALAGEIGARFQNVGLSDVLDMYIGESERKLHELFENARRQPPSVVFFDEIDGLGMRRTQLRNSGGRNIVGQLLAELDGFAARNEGVFFLGATNHPWDLDPALRRPGRFDHLVFVPPPDGPARQKILELKLAKRPCAPRLDLARVVAATEGFSGADLQLVVDTATDDAIDRTVASGQNAVIDEPSLSRAVKATKPSARAWLETARNYAVYSNEGGMLDDLLAYLKKVGIA